MKRTVRAIGMMSAAFAASAALAQTAADESQDRRACEALVDTPDLAITSARIKPASGDTPAYCYVKGTISPQIRYHLQLPLPGDWNGRFLSWGDGGKDGDLDFADHRLAEGYAVANSNMGHDSGAEPGTSFAYDNRQAEIDFGYRAVHLMVNAAKTAIRAYYGRPPDHSYHEGCSTGGREGLMEAQRFPYDFDGIVAGAPVIYYQQLNAGHTWLLQRTFRDHYAGNLAYDTDGDGTPDSLRKLDVLHEAVLARCDANDGIKDGVVDNPMQCDFDPRRDLKDKMCPSGQDGDACFTEAQIKTVEDFLKGPYDSRGKSFYKGRALGGEYDWARWYVPYAGNRMRPLALGFTDHIPYLFYEVDPGVPVHDPADLSHPPDRHATPPEWAWWEWSADDFTAGRADAMAALTNATDPRLSRFLVDNRGKLIVYHGWADGGVPPEPTVDYYNAVVDATFGGDLKKAREDARLFMLPGMEHCGGGHGPDTFDALKPLVSWVEQGVAPEDLVATHSTNGKVDNERRVCAYPDEARYVGPPGGQNDRANWVAANFECRAAR
ncbi:MAG TPA: tannase/feruloyl esterase family alpha/beta hydrolase [Gammaproteobacteria bacterium]|nr:tannase/feruloyl esterase family alpha/beta hydrolase [Gammaproteobacteria bacterium]